MEVTLNCKKCGSSNTVSRGIKVQCKECGAWTRKKYIERHYSVQQPSGSRMSEDSRGNGEYVTYTHARITTLEQLIDVCQIDMEYWEIDHWICNKWEIGAKNINKELDVEPLFQIKVWLKKRVVEIAAKKRFDLLVDAAKAFAPVYPKINYPAVTDGMMYEIAMPDLQLGRMVMGSSVGSSFDQTPEASIVRAERAIDSLLGLAKPFPLERILFPVGNDFFDSDNPEMTTVHGTPQLDDPRWHQVFDMGVQFIIRSIDKMSTLAPVDVVIIPGNHDETKTYYMGRELVAWYHNNPNVAVDNEERLRKYYSFGKNLIGLTHGYYEKHGRLESLMAYEEPLKWALSRNREWHLGDKHHKADMVMKTEEYTNGVVVRIFRSLASPSVWEYNKGFAALRAAEGLLWHPERGIMAQFTAAAV